jgi:flagellar hook-associated protein 1 FlgK
MLGLFGTLNLAQRSLQNQQQGIEVTGHNLANVNNPAYARQHIVLQTSSTLDTPLGPQGTGANVVAIQQLRSVILDTQLQGEISVTGFLDASQQALQYAQTDLGQQIDRRATGAEGASAAQGVGGQHAIAEGLSDLFNAFQSLSTSPTSLTERQLLVTKAQTLAGQFNQVDDRLNRLSSALDNSIQTDLSTANKFITSIAKLNDQIIKAELRTAGSANDLRDTRQEQIEGLAKLVDIQTASSANGGIDVSIGRVSFISGGKALDTLEAYDAGGGQVLVRAQTAQTSLSLTGGSVQGNIETRDGTISNLQSNLNSLASVLITEINQVHRAGFGLDDSTGADFFTGTTATDIKVNDALLANPASVQVSGVAATAGDNQIALALGQLADKKHAALNNQTFSQNYGQTVAALGASLASTNSKLSDQNLVENLLQRQRDSISGVSLDEEMTELMKFQKTYQASARLITTVDEMLDTVINM